MNKIIYILLIAVSATCYAQREGQKIRDAINEAMENGEYKKASNMYDHLFNCDLGNEKYALYFDYAFAQYHLSNYKLAQVYLNRAIKIEKNNIDFDWVKSKSYALLASINGKNDKLNKQVDNLLKAIQFEKTSGYLTSLGFVYTKLKKYGKALRILNEAIELDTENAFAYNNRALAKMKLKMFESAKSDLEKSLALDANNAFAYKNKALLHFYLNQHSLACVEYNKAKKLGYTIKDPELTKIENKCLK